MTLIKDKPIIAIDIDDVLSESVKDIIKYSNEHWGLSLKSDDYNEHFSEMWQVDFTEARRRLLEYINSGIMFKYSHISGANFVLRKLKQNYKLIIITSREVSLKEGTIIWLNEKFPGIFNKSDIHFAGIWEKGVSHTAISATKAEISKKLHADYLIDDQFKHCEGAASIGIKSLLFGNYHWNKSDNLPKNVYRVSNWQEIQRFFNNEQK